MKRRIITALTVAASLAITAAPAHAMLPLVRCHDSAGDRKYAVVDLTASRGGCPQAQEFAFLFQRANFTTGIVKQGRIKFTDRGHPYQMELHYKQETGVLEDPTLLITAAGVGNGLFIFFETDQ